jgi:hypothetical protein
MNGKWVMYNVDLVKTITHANQCDDIIAAIEVVPYAWVVIRYY